MELIDLTIRSLGASGEGIASKEGFVFFVEGALPGEQITAEVTLLKKNYGKARLVNILTPSPDRIVPPCPVFGRCGGCQLQHMNYEAQLRVKRSQVVDALERIGGFKGIEVDSCVPSEKQFGYRNKIQLPVLYSPEGVVLGLYAAGSHDVIPIDRCLIHCPLGEEVFQKIKRMTPPRQGKIRYVLIKSAVKRGEVLVVLVTTGLEEKWLQEFAESLSVQGVVENINTSSGNAILSAQFRTVSGTPYIEEEICGKTFQVSGHSFFQVNPAQAEKLYQKTVELSEIDKNKTLLDAFCGVGTFALIASDYAKKVVGIECVRLSVEDAKANALRNGITNVSFILGFAEKKRVDADVTFLNPPRKGCEPSLLHALQSPVVMYMSCNPATLARDLQILNSRYTIQTVIPYDMFPQTTHVETLVKLVRRVA